MRFVEGDRVITLADLAHGVVQGRNGAYVYIQLDSGAVREVYDNEIAAADPIPYRLTEAGRAMLAQQSEQGE